MSLCHFVLVMGIAITLSMFGCAGNADRNTAARDDAPGKRASVNGSVTYRPRITLPPDARIHVTLDDVSRADAPSIVIGESTFNSDGRQVPIPFTIHYPLAAITPSSRYTVRAQIYVGDKLAFTSTTATPYQPTTDALTILVSPVSASVPPPGPATVAVTPLEGTYWKLIDIGGTPAVEMDGFREAFLQFHAKMKHVSGMGGVNGVGGTYEYTGERSLRIVPGPSTMMAGPEPLMKQETALGKAIGKADSFRVTGQQLELLAGETVVARFQAKPAPAPLR